MPSVLVTGAGRGIGAAIAARLARAGWDVYGGVRDPAATLPAGATAVTLDITDAAHVAALDDALPERLDAVVNNAGVVVGGPVEALPLDELRRQLEVNVVGQVAVTQALLPRLRSSRGRVVFVSSVSGMIATPMTGAYNASKFGLEAIADSLRMEVRPWGIRVVVVQPSQTDTAMWQDAGEETDRIAGQMSPAHRKLYASHLAGWRKRLPFNQRIAVPPDDVAASVQRALSAKRPRARYVVGAPQRVQAGLAKLTPTPVMDAVLRAGTGMPRRP